MVEAIYLIVDRNKVVRMVKTLGKLERGQIPVKLNVTVKPEAFREPVIVRDVVIDDWTEGIDLQDVQFEKSVITAEEAEVVKKMRLEKMATILQQHGFTVEAKAGDEE